MTKEMNNGTGEQFLELTKEEMRQIAACVRKAGEQQQDFGGSTPGQDAVASAYNFFFAVGLMMERAAFSRRLVLLAESSDAQNRLAGMLGLKACDLGRRFVVVIDPYDMHGTAPRLRSPAGARDPEIRPRRGMGPVSKRQKS